MAQRKLQQEVDRCFKRVAEGITAFEGIFDKIQQTANQAQKEKLEDALKREIKKLQRQRDQIKTWAASNEIKDKKPLLEQRKLIETQMEKFKAVEKEMKTKAYSKEGLSAAAKLDPKEQERVNAGNFISTMVEELERQIETLEAESETLQVTVKKGKKDASKADRVSEIEHLTERHKWHQAKLELLLRALENGGIETETVTELEESIRYYVENNADADFMEDDAIYDDLNLVEGDELDFVSNDMDPMSSHENQAGLEEMPDRADGGGRGPNGTASGKPKSTSISEHQVSSAARRPSMHTKSPLPTLATLHAPSHDSLGGGTMGGPSVVNMKPAPIPTRPPGETLKYASAAAAATATVGSASDKNSLGIAPLPPPPGTSSVSVASGSTTSLPGLAPLSAIAGAVGHTTEPKVHATGSFAAAQSHPPVSAVSGGQTPAQRAATLASTASSGTSTAGHAPGVSTKTPILNTVRHVSTSQSSASHVAAAMATATTTVSASASPKESERHDAVSRGALAASIAADARSTQRPRSTTTSRQQQLNGSGSPAGKTVATDEDAPASIYHLPPSLSDLMASFETTRARVAQQQVSGEIITPLVQRHLQASAASCPLPSDADRPKPYTPSTRHNTPSFYPQEPLATLDDPRLYSRVDTDTLFYVFYYRQGSYQQYLAAKALKQQSWRFHKQYQTWFQRHEEPKTITEEFEQGTYRFFDYESTWMNRRKGDFKFAYKFLEDDL